MSSIFLIAIQVDTAAPHIMAQSAFKPIGLYDPDDQFHLRHPDDEYPQDIEDPNHQTASILRNVVTKQNGNTNPSHHAILFLMELRAALENRYFFVDICHETMATTRDIENAMFILEEFLQNITDLDGTFQKAIQPCLESAARIRDLAKISASNNPNGIAKLRRLRACQLKQMHRLQGGWEDLLQTAREYDESVTFRRLSEIIESTEDAADEAWLF